MYELINKKWGLNLKKRTKKARNEKRLRKREEA